MTTQTTTLAEFLLARIGEDERAALMAGAVRYDADLMAKGNPNLTAPHVAHIVRHGPAEVLAECAAKRRIVELHTYPSMACYWTHDGGATHEPGEACDTLRILALPYADHSEWREEWRP